MTIKQTHSYATVEVSVSAYHEIATAVRDAEQGERINSDNEIDMQGLAIALAPSQPVPQVATESARTLRIDYTNWHGRRAIREIIPIRVFYGMNQWHQDFQWMIEAIDKESHGVRTFAMKNIHSYML